MPKVKFTKNFDFSPKENKGNYTIAYKAGTVANVTTECVEMAGNSLEVLTSTEAKNAKKK